MTKSKCCSSARNFSKTAVDDGWLTLQNGKKYKKVDVNEENPQALAFYLHMGFNIAGRSEVDGNGKPHPLLFLQKD